MRARRRRRRRRRRRACLFFSFLWGWRFEFFTCVLRETRS
jgi:hypothetical protein